METHHPHTDLLSNTVYKPPMLLFTRRLPPGPLQSPLLLYSVSPDNRFSGTRISILVYIDKLHQPRPYRLNRGFLLPTIQTIPFMLFSPPPRTTLVRTRSHGHPLVRSTLFLLDSNRYIRRCCRSSRSLTTVFTVYTICPRKSSGVKGHASTSSSNGSATLPRIFPCLIAPASLNSSSSLRISRLVLMKPTYHKAWLWACLDASSQTSLVACIHPMSQWTSE